MKTLAEFEQEFSKLLIQVPFPVNKLRELIKELDEFIYSSEYERLTFTEKEKTQDLLNSMKSKYSNTSDPFEQSPHPDNSETDQNGNNSYSSNSDAPIHDNNAEQIMNKAEEHFYAGQYNQAINLYDQVLKIEPNWERAKEHRTQAMHYMQTGEIPTIAIPPEAAIYYGKAQSAIRVGRYPEALQLFNNAKGILTESGITRWNEGQEFEVHLEALVQAENIAKGAVELFNQGKIDEAILDLETVYRETQIPRHKDLADKYKNFRLIQQQISDIFFAAGTATPEMLIQAAQNMEKLSAEFNANPALQSLRTKFDLLKPALTGSLRQEIRSLKSQAERAPNMDRAREHAEEAKKRIDLAIKLGLTDGMFTSTIREITQLTADLDRYSQDIEQAESSLLNNRKWAKDAWNISTDVRKRYPQDSSVIRLNKDLISYKIYRIIIFISISIVVLIGLIYGVVKITDKIHSYHLSLTPTITPTFTPTFTPTPTDTPTPLPPTITPTPIEGHVIRAVWARNGCYESYTAIGRIPENAPVKLLPGERRFDNLSRECILVEYIGTDKSVIGWILIQDFQP